MFFDSPVYFVFLFVVVTIYWQLSQRSQNAFLLLASYFFYGWWDWRFLSLVMLSTVVDYYLAHIIDRSDDQKVRRNTLAVSVAINVGFLAYFKYCNFFIDSMVGLLAAAGVQYETRPLLEIILPPGISFYTFQAIAYMVDVRNRKVKPAKSLIDYALFISLFPHLVAGPIQRPGHLLPQVEGTRSFDASRVNTGLMLIAWGLFRKCVIADNCALIANAAFSGSLGPPSLAVLLIGGYAFAWQIYGDFSGYSQIARGSALLMGFDFMVNFRQPYLATSLQDFWRRWHISLSTWLRDYLYIPLGGSRQGETRTQVNLMVTMLIGGLWHGANLTFVVWGAIHGLGLALGRRLSPVFQPLQGTAPALNVPYLRVWLKRLVVFHIVCAAWIFFRAETMTGALQMFAGATSLSYGPNLGTAFLQLAVFAVPMLLIDLKNEKDGTEYPLEKSRFDWIAAAFALLAVAVLTGNNADAFIYFQF